MNAADVMAVVVSFNGRESTKLTVQALLPQVRHVFVVDNGSDAESLAILDSLERECAVSVRRLGTNSGIGHALNLGIARAKEIECAWLLTMDQDSVADAGMVGAYLSEIVRNPAAVSLSPRMPEAAAADKAASVEIRSAITSGNLVNVGVFDKIGAYDEGFFIDCIDFDFSLRLRSAGYKLLRIENAGMRHQLGEVTDLPGYVTKFYAQHSALRRYYMTRNYLYLAERHLFRFPVFIAKLGILRAVLLVLIAFFDRAPMSSYRAIAKGVRDYVMRRRGPYRGASL